MVLENGLESDFIPRILVLEFQTKTNPASQTIHNSMKTRQIKTTGVSAIQCEFNLADLFVLQECINKLKESVNISTACHIDEDGIIHTINGYTVEKCTRETPGAFEIAKLVRFVAKLQMRAETATIFDPLQSSDVCEEE